MPILGNLARIRRAAQRTLQHFDPPGTSTASHGMVLIGHSMGGVLTRLLVSTSDEELWTTFQDEYLPKGAKLDREDERLNRLLRFSPMPQVERAIFIADPHRGTPFASNRLSRWATNLVRLPLALLQEIDEVMRSATHSSSSEKERQTSTCRTASSSCAGAIRSFRRPLSCRSVPKSAFTRSSRDAAQRVL